MVAFTRSFTGDPGVLAGEPPRLAADRETPVVAVGLEERRVRVHARRYDIAGSSRYVVPVLLLHTDWPENSEADRAIRDRLYGEDGRDRSSREREKARARGAWAPATHEAFFISV